MEWNDAYARNGTGRLTPAVRRIDECAACLDALVAKTACTLDRVQPGKAMLERVVSMLTKLVARFDSDEPRTPEP